jgi:ABC-2 type transport system permease protein
LSFVRFWGVVLKEFLQLKRERITFAMVLGIPIAQLLLFGYAINTDPKQLPTASSPRITASSRAATSPP